VGKAPYLQGVGGRRIGYQSRPRYRPSSATALYSSGAAVGDRLAHLDTERVGNALQPVEVDAAIAVGLPPLDLLLGDADPFGELTLGQAGRDASFYERGWQPPVWTGARLRRAMPRARLLLLPLLGLSLLAAKALASGPEAAITRAAVAPFQDALRDDAAALCGDLVPAVAAELVQGSAAAGGCNAAASGEFALTAPNEPPADPGLSLKPTVEDLEVAGQRATLKLSFTFLTLTVTKKPGLTVYAIHHAGPIELDLEEVGGAWLVSSRARLATVPGCYLPKPRRCPRGARVLIFFAGEVEPSPSGLELPRPVVPESEGRRKREVEAGRLDVAQSGCLACHRIGDSGNRGPGENLTHIGSRLSEREIAHAIVDPRAPMPSFRHLPAQKLRDVVRFLAALRQSPDRGAAHARR
jgi:hypothetical protein